MVGANFHGVNTADVRVIKLVVRPLMRGGIKKRFDIDTLLGDLPRFRPLFVLEVKTYSCFLLLRGFRLVERTSRFADYKGLPFCNLSREDIGYESRFCGLCVVLIELILVPRTLGL